MSDFLALFLPSIAAIFLLSIAISVVGSFMLFNRYAYLAASIAHGSYGGIGLALFFGLPLLTGTTTFALFLALLLAYLTYKGHPNEVIISMIWAAGMSVGIILSDLTPGYHTDLMAYLFGNILMVAKEDLIYMVAVDFLALLSAFFLLHQLLAVAYDKEFARLRGIKVGLIHTLNLILIALTIVMSIRAIGLILVIALFTIPPYIAQKLTSNIRQMMVATFFIALFIGLIGLWIAYIFNISATAAIILLAAILIFVKGRA